MNQKRMMSLGTLGLLFSMLFASSFVSALTTSDIDQFFGSYINPFVKYILGDVGTGQTFFIKFLFAIIIFAVVFYSVKQVPSLGKGMTLWLITIAVTLLAVRFLSNETIINFLWLPQGVLGVALATLLPFILFFFFIESFADAPIIRKVGWSVFAVIYVMLALLRWEDLAIAGTTAAGGASANLLAGFNLGWFYLIIAGLSLLAIFADKGIRAAYLRNKSMAYIRGEKALTLARLENKLVLVNDALAERPESKSLENKKESLEKSIAKMNKQLGE
jgi:hypothetical protein